MVELGQSINSRTRTYDRRHPTRVAYQEKALSTPRPWSSEQHYGIFARVVCQFLLFYTLHCSGSCIRLVPVLAKRIVTAPKYVFQVMSQSQEATSLLPLLISLVPCMHLTIQGKQIKVSSLDVGQFCHFSFIVLKYIYN